VYDFTRTLPMPDHACSGFFSSHPGWSGLAYFEMRASTPMIIDCHGYYTTAPPALEAWRTRQIAGIKECIQ
jgi:hypothetical protein